MLHEDLAGIGSGEPIQYFTFYQVLTITGKILSTLVGRLTTGVWIKFMHNSLSMLLPRPLGRG